MRYQPLRKEVLQKQAAQAVSSGSILVGNFLKKWFGLKSNFVTWGGVDLPQEAPIAGSNCGALFLGRLSADTVPLAYLDAMSLVDRGLRDKMKLTFVGDGPSHAALEEKARRASFEVRLEGFQEDPTTYIAGCGLLFAPGYLSILEGLAWRKPIFCLAANEMRMDYFSEIAECSRSIHLAREPSELARLVGAWLEKSPMEKAEILEAGFELARFHSWQKVTDLYISLWQS